MADSLRDQLIAAGYEAPKKEQKNKPRPQDNAKGNKKPARKGKKPVAKNRSGPAARHNSGKRQADSQSADALKAVSYTHLTLPTTPYV